jgi:hypothetical protein
MGENWPYFSQFSIKRDLNHILILHNFTACIKNTRPITKLVRSFLDNRPIKVVRHDSAACAAVI